MKDLLIFLGSGASAPFGLPTMEDFIRLFEEELKKSSVESTVTSDDKAMQLYQSIKTVLINTYGYADLESVFSVLKANIRRG